MNVDAFPFAVEALEDIHENILQSV